MIGERVCACGCGAAFWPHRVDQRYRSPWCRAAAWRERRSERFAEAARTNPAVAGREAFTEELSHV